ncbi:MAG: hypothetical protein LBJ38_01930 [Oscillospiraceae bacterium]|jgi:hypothetical protein|nr:hypothetical protein [Oscillospiraceae bacterium]
MMIDKYANLLRRLFFIGLAFFVSTVSTVAELPPAYFLVDGELSIKDGSEYYDAPRIPYKEFSERQIKNLAGGVAQHRGAEVNSGLSAVAQKHAESIYRGENAGGQPGTEELEANGVTNTKSTCVLECICFTYGKPTPEDLAREANLKLPPGVDAFGFGVAGASEDNWNLYVIFVVGVTYNDHH